LGGPHSLIEQPRLCRRQQDPNSQNLLRLSIGWRTQPNLIADLKQGLTRSCVNRPLLAMKPPVSCRRRRCRGGEKLPKTRVDLAAIKVISLFSPAPTSFAAAIDPHLALQSEGFAVLHPKYVES